ncbi:hypothetical protein Tsubulata_025152 [Turnera subulata]|uniref:Senescence regulator n=1 Tax=Turnera subulata TaxID=218843 RepID=A0A9Q0FBZ7_9ROSI|nr:hypothetical protein Tsubulata_025152 [Turnera subulata]
MAKGRRLTTSRSERLLGSYAYGNGQDATGGTGVSELGEEDVWSMVDDVAADRGDQIVHNPRGEWAPRPVGEREASFPRTVGRRRIQRDERHVVGGLSLAFVEDPSSAGNNKTATPRIVHQFRAHDSVAGTTTTTTAGGGAATTTPRHMATSAPVNVPDWSKILRVDSVDSLQELDGGGYDDDDEGGEDEMVPPHEYLAREYARNRRMGGASVCEGVGRTLKGRDLRRVRDAVWSQTGFDG